MNAIPFYMVADLTNPAAEPFAVLAVHPDRRMGGGCEARVVSLHWSRDEAERVVAAGGSIAGATQ